MSNFDDFLAMQGSILESDEERKRISARNSQDFEKLVSTVEGRAFIRLLLGECGIARGSFDADNTHRTAYLEGRRSIGLWIQQEFEKHPDKWIQLLTDKHND